MKKLVVALLIVAMLVSAFVICVPMNTSAAEETVGATITTTWTGTHKTEAEIEAETGKSFTPITSYQEYCGISSGTADAIKYYCLVLPEGTETLALNGGAEHDKHLSYIYFDFNGYSVDVSGNNNALFTTLQNATIKNLKIVGDLNYVSDRTYYSKYEALGMSPLTNGDYDKVVNGAAGVNGVIHLDNIVSEINWTILQQHGGNKYMGGIVQHAASGSTIKNCVFNGTIIAKNDTDAITATAGTSNTVLKCQVGRLGGIIGSADGVSVENCQANGSLTLEDGIYFATSGNGYGRVGGIVGYSATTTTVSNCENNMDITVNSRGYASASDTADLADGYIGGIVGYRDNSSGNIENCTNTGNITITAGLNYAGGILGYTTVATTIIDSSNDGAIKATPEITSSRYLGGILGYANANGTSKIVKLDGCVNSGAITAEKNYYHIGGVAGGAYKANFQVVDCENTATGTVTYYAAGSTMRGAGGIVGYSYESIFSASGCTNRGAITQTTGSSAVQNMFIGGIVGRLYTNAQSATIENCTNEGTVTGAQNATAANSGAGGIVGTLQSGGSGSSLTISGCINNSAGTIDGRNSGGIMGTFYVNDNTCTLTITGSKNYAKVNAKYNAGGILGNSTEATATAAGTLEISSCENEGAVSATNNAGGIAGYILGNANFNTCVNKGSVAVTYSGTFNKDVTEATSNYSASAVVRAGGIVGFAEEGLTIGISGCDNYGSVNATGTASGTLTTLTADEAAALEEGTEPMTATFSFSVDAGGIIPVADGVLTISNCNTYNSASLIKASLTNSVKKVGAYATVSSTPEAAGGIVGRIVVAPTFSGNMTTANSASADYAGGVAGYTELELTLDGFTNSGNMSATYAGGILGYTTNNLTVTNCTNLGNITSSGHSAGGIVSLVGKSLTISNCINGAANTNKGAVTQGSGSDSGGLGGIVGRINVDLIMEGCTNYGPVNTASVYGSAAKYVGGMVGRVVKAAYIGYTVESATTDTRVFGGKCYNYGKVTINQVFNNNNTNYVGGIIGEAVTGLYLANCENHGDIEVKASIENNSSRSGVGGMVGVPFAAGGAVVVIDSCDNYGDIIYNSTMANTWGASGIMGRIFSTYDPVAKMTVTNCNNYGDIYSDTSVEMLYAGGIVGYHQGNTLTISGCTNSGAIDGNYAGGIDGYSGVAVTISDSSNSGHINSSTCAAGIVGYAGAKPTLSGCIVTADTVITVTGDSGVATGYAGGMIGRGYSAPSVTDCTASGKIIVKDWILTSDSYVAGITGHTQGGSYLRCTSNVNIEITNSGLLGGVGGIIGRTNTAMTVEDCHNTGDISIDGDSTFKISDNNFGNGVGGVMGNGLGITFKNCSNSGDITVSTETSVGGIVGLNSSGLAVMGFESCKNTGDITVITGVAADRGVGGILGYGATAGLKFTSCENSGDITGQHFLGGILGKTSKDSTFIDCTNKGTISVDMLSDYGVGGVVGFSTGITLTRCINDGPVTSRGTHTGGLAGRVNGVSVITDCENTANGIIIFTENSTIGSSGTMTGVGGIIGYVSDSNGNATITYCVNNAVIKSSDVATGFKTYMGGIVGRAANPCEFQITYCTNNGDVTSATISTSHAGGILGLHQNYSDAATDAADYYIGNCVNTGNISAYRVGGMLGTSELGGSASATTHYGAITIENCVNSGDISAVSYGGGIAGYTVATAKTKMTYVITNCVNLGTITGTQRAGILACVNNAETTITGCIVAGDISNMGEGTHSIIAPEITGDYATYTVSVTGCYYLNTIGATNYYSSGITAKTADQIRELIRGANTTTIVFDKANLEILYRWALQMGATDSDEFKKVEQIVVRGTEEGGQRLYFTITQWEADGAYDALYAVLNSVSVEATFTIYLPVSITINDGGVITIGSIANFTPTSTIAITVAQNGASSNFLLYRNGDPSSDTLEFCLIAPDGSEVYNNGTLLTIDWDCAAETKYEFGADLKSAEDIPGEYKGTLTFSVNYDDGK